MNSSAVSAFQSSYFAISFWLLTLFLSVAPVAPVTAQAPDELESTLVEQRLEGLRKDGNAHDSEIIQAYEEIRKLLIQAESSQREAANYNEAMTAAPQREAEIQARIDSIENAVEASEKLDSLVEEEIEARLIIGRAELSEAHGSLAGVDQHLARRETDANTIRSRLAEMKTRFDVLPTQDVFVDSAAQASLAEASEWLKAAKRSAIVSERRALEARLASQPLRHKILAVERAEISLIAGRLTQQVLQLETHLKERLTESLGAESVGIHIDDPAYSLATLLVQYDNELRADSFTVNEGLISVRRQIVEVEGQSRELADDFASARRMAEFAAGSEELGGMLLAYSRALSMFRLASPTNFSREAGSAVIRRIEVEQKLKQLSSATSYINLKLEKDGIAAEEIPNGSFLTLVNLAKSYRARLRNMVGLQSGYINSLTSLNDSYVELTTLHKKYDKYLQGLILWIPSYPPLWHIDTDSVSAELDALREMLGSVRFSLNARLFFGLTIFAFLFFQRYRLLAYQQELNGRIARARSDSIGHTLLALICVALRALPLPALFWAVGSGLSPQSLGMILINVSLALFALQSIRIICEPSGVASLQFKWPDAPMVQIRQELGQLIKWWLPLGAVFFLIIRANMTSEYAVTARFAIAAFLVVPLIIFAVSFYKNVQGAPQTWNRGLSNRFRLALMLTLIALIAAVLIGHIYSVFVINSGIVTTLWSGICLLVIHSVLIRWVRVTRRRLRMAELLKLKAERLDKTDVVIEEQVTNLGVISTDSRQLINVGVVTAAVMAIFYIWSPLLPALDVFDKVILWTSTAVSDGETVKNVITLKTLLLVFILAGLTVYSARKLPAVIDLLLGARDTISSSARYTVSALLNYVVIGGATFFGLSALGLQWAELQWLVAAMGVGIGFGLQEIIANFISGIIILFERPIRVGDVVTIAEQDGVVTRIRIRATTIRDWNGKELLVPNKEFITGQLLNWSLSDPKIRIVLPIGIAYGSDVEMALKTLHEIVSQHPRVVDDPEPRIVFEGFGDNALQLSARCFIDSMENRVGVVSELNREIYSQFGQAGIVIAFPQRDIHFDESKTIRIALEEAPDKPA